ncbi:hypothetical protein MBLNU230_g1647t1 [Neophaeotheca triangularis]
MTTSKFVEILDTSDTPYSLDNQYKQHGVFVDEIRMHIPDQEPDGINDERPSARKDEVARFLAQEEQELKYCRGSIGITIRRTDEMFYDS